VTHLSFGDQDGAEQYKNVYHNWGVFYKHVRGFKVVWYPVYFRSLCISEQYMKTGESNCDILHQNYFKFININRLRSYESLSKGCRGNWQNKINGSFVPCI